MYTFHLFLLIYLFIENFIQCIWPYFAPIFLTQDLNSFLFHLSNVYAIYCDIISSLRTYSFRHIKILGI